MANVIDLRRLRGELKGGMRPENELPAPEEPLLIETEEAAHPEGMPPAGAAEPFLEWETFEFEFDENRSVTLLLLGVLVILGSIAAFFFWNALFGIALFLAGGIVIAYAYQPPRLMRCAITPRGVEVGRRLYLFEDLRSFWIFYDPPRLKELVLESRKTIMSRIAAPLGDLDPLRLREVLLRFLPEQRQEESLIDILGKHLGF